MSINLKELEDRLDKALSNETPSSLKDWIFQNREQILHNYVCVVPFTYLEIHKDEVYGCCPSWMKESYGSTDNLKQIWNDEIATKTRESVLNGSYSYCDKNNCPHLSKLIYTEMPSEVFIEKKFFNTKKGPIRLNLCFDKSCILACPSCRKEILMSDDKEVEEINNIMKDVSEVFKESVTTIYLSGTSEPFASKTYKNFLINFNRDYFPKLDIIHLHSNGLLLDEEMWNKIQKSHEYIKTIEISIDAATKETYKKVRGGNWDKLIENLRFISSIKTIAEKRFSFVVQDTNYKEMEMFYNLISNLPHNTRYNIYYGKILNWGTYSEEEYINKQIWNENHTQFNDFLTELSKIAGKPRIFTNLNDIIDKYKLMPKPNKFI